MVKAPPAPAYQNPNKLLQVLEEGKTPPTHTQADTQEIL